MTEYEFAMKDAGRKVVNVFQLSQSLVSPNTSLLFSIGSVLLNKLYFGGRAVQDLTKRTHQRPL